MIDPRISLYIKTSMRLFLLMFEIIIKLDKPKEDEYTYRLNMLRDAIKCSESLNVW
jgi:hypothetical protein